MAGGQGIEHGAGVCAAAQDFEQPAACVGAIVKAEPAFLEENVSTHLATQRRVGFLHAGLDERVAGLEHHRHTTRLGNGGRQALGALHVKNDLTAGHAREHILRKQHHLAVGEDIGAVLGDDAQPVAVAVKRQAQFRIAGLQGGDQVTQVLGLAGVGVVVGEVAVHLRKQLNHLATQRAEDGRGRCTRNAIAAVHHHLHGAGQFHIAHDTLAVGAQHIGLAHTAARLQLPAFFFHGAAQGLDFLAINGAACQHHLEAVVVLGVVAARDLDAAGAQRVRREVQHGRGDHAHVDHFQARLHQALDEGCSQTGARQPPVAPHRHHPLALRTGRRAKRPAQAQCHRFVQGGGHDAANVIGFEDGGRCLHVRAFQGKSSGKSGPDRSSRPRKLGGHDARQKTAGL